jgi:hypothetical protein
MYAFFFNFLFFEIGSSCFVGDSVTWIRPGAGTQETRRARYTPQPFLKNILLCLPFLGLSPWQLVFAPGLFPPPYYIFFLGFSPSPHPTYQELVSMVSVSHWVSFLDFTLSPSYKPPCFFKLHIIPVQRTLVTDYRLSVPAPTVMINIWWQSTQALDLEVFVASLPRPPSNSSVSWYHHSIILSLKSHYFLARQYHILKE